MSGCEGEKVLSLLIEQSLRPPSVYLEVRKRDDNWLLYWNYELPVSELLSTLKEYAKEHHMSDNVTLQELFKNKDAMQEVSKHCKTYSCELSSEEIKVIEDIATNGLPEIDKRKPQGLDGHSYELICYDIGKEYRCWCVLPKEWERLISLIDVLCRKAELSDIYFAYSV